MSLSQLPRSHLASGRAEMWILVESGCARASSPETQEGHTRKHVRNLMTQPERLSSSQAISEFRFHGSSILEIGRSS